MKKRSGYDIGKNDWGKRLKENPSAFFEYIFRDMSPKLYRFALAYTMNSDMAEDIVQDTFLHLWANVDSLLGDTNIEKYLYSCVKNSCLNYYKHLQVEDSNRTKLTEALIYLGTLEYEDNSTLFEKVQECLQKLPDQQQKVLELKICSNMSYKEIARELDILETSVHTHVKRAYKFIRESLPLFHAFMILKGVFYF